MSDDQYVTYMANVVQAKMNALYDLWSAKIHYCKSARLNECLAKSDRQTKMWHRKLRLNRLRKAKAERKACNV